MEDILRNLNLWNEISDNCKDVWKYMKEKKFDNSLSNGQKQRLIIAKILYFLDNEIDALVLDECTSGLDDKDKNSVNTFLMVMSLIAQASAIKKLAQRIVKDYYTE